MKECSETSIPASVMVLEAWSDEETFYIWNDAEYEPREDGGAFRYEDFSFREDGKWPDPMAFVNKLGAGRSQARAVADTRHQV